MIRRLRRRHLWLVALVAVASAAVLIAALAARPEPPLQDTLPRLEVETAAPSDSPAGDEAAADRGAG